MYRLKNLKMHAYSATVLLTVVYFFVLPTDCHQYEFLNRTNVIDRRRSINGHSAEDQSVDDVPTSSCGSCELRENIRTRSLDNIKQQILNRLGMQHAPNTTGRKLPNIPQDILSQYPGLQIHGMMSDEPQPSFKPGPIITEEEDHFHIKTESVITFAKPYPRLRHSWKGHGILHFPFSEKITKHRVKQATLYLWVKGSGDRRPSTADIVLEVFKVSRDPRSPETPKLERKSRAIIRQSAGDGQLMKLDTTVMVSEWFKSPRDNLGFVVNGTLNGEKIIVTDASTDGGSKVPFVEILTTNFHKRRTKRTISLNCNEKTEESMCCRYPLIVDFEEFGWDFIIQPKRYEAYYCAGDCPYLTLQKYVHTHLVQMSLASQVGACCAPRKMSPIDMLYFDQESNIIYGKLPGMVVDRCGCS